MRDSRRSFNPRKRPDPSPGGYARRRILPGNAVVAAIMQCSQVHGQPCYRMQSRQFEVEGQDERKRPFFVGQWTDRFGTVIMGGMADCLCTPTIELGGYRVQLALWIEAKSGGGVLTKKQQLFRDNVLATGGEWLLCRDSAEELLRWFSEHRLVRP